MLTLVMTEFLFFRHGETDWNLKNIFQGHSDIRLNDTGVQQAKFLAEKIQYWKPDLILTSDLTRAYYTAEYCRLEWKVPMITSAELREMHLGKAEGLHRDDVQKMVGADLWSKWYSHENEDFGFPEGESKSQAKARVLGYLEKFVKGHPQYKKIAVSTHGGILRRVTSGLKGVPEKGVAIPNCATYRLNYDGFNWQYLPVRERSSVVVVAKNKILTFFAVDPFSGKEYHFLPGGLIENNESVQECARRECLEETGFEIVPDSKVLTSEYDFNWNNNQIWCRTHFLKADLKSDINAPQVVRDADYNKGVRWVPVEDFASYFYYSESIFENIKKILG
jgi:2,3-bisphosphoglycerate-dependent phosphoglycerate mutase